MGSAIDIDVTASDRKETIIAASRAGFGGIRVFPSYIQLHNGRRSYYVDESIGEEEKAQLTELLSKHDIDGFRIKRS